MVVAKRDSVWVGLVVTVVESEMDRTSVPTDAWPLCTLSPTRAPVAVELSTRPATLPPTTPPSSPSPAPSSASPCLSAVAMGEEYEAEMLRPACAAIDGASNDAAVDTARVRSKRLRPEIRTA